MSRAALNRVMLTASENDAPMFQLQAFEVIGNGAFAASFGSMPRSKNFRFDDYNAVVHRVFDDKLNIVADSLFKTPDRHSYRCILAGNGESREYTEASVAGMKPIRANLFEDGDNNLWRVVGESGAQQLVQITPEDYSVILKARQRPSLTASDEMQVPFDEADYVYYFNPELEAMDFGIVIKHRNRTIVASNKQRKALDIKPCQIMEALAHEKQADLIAERRRIEAASGSLKEYLDFIARQYGRDSVYYKAMAEAVARYENRVQ